MDLSFGLTQELQGRVSPSLIALNNMLVLSSQELQEAIRQELDSNPALEMEERRICPTCGSSYKGDFCRRCLADNLNDPNYSSNISKSTSDDYEWSYSPDSGGGGNSDFDPMSIVAAEMSMTERILSDLNATLEPEDLPIAEFLVGSLDERGYLSASTASIAQTFNCDEAEVVRILNELQQVAPPGVGARDPRECLLLQIRYLKEQGAIAPHVEDIIDRFYNELGEHKYGYIAGQLGITTDDIKAAREFIRHNLNPYPAEGQTGELNGVRYGAKAQYVTPDVIISEFDGEFKAEVIESKRFFLKVNSLYMQLSQGTATQSEADREHVQQYLSRAKQFMSNINQRRQTMLKISEALVKIQEEFLRDGVRGLRPLTRATLASYIGLHESTVSRATAGKFVMLPNRKVIPFTEFFQQSLSVKDVIKEIIEKAESNGKPKLTDLEIVELLAQDYNITIARRTVAKYRAQLKILPSTLR